MCVLSNNSTSIFFRISTFTKCSYSSKKSLPIDFGIVGIRQKSLTNGLWDFSAQNDLRFDLLLRESNKFNLLFG